MIVTDDLNGMEGGGAGVTPGLLCCPFCGSGARVMSMTYDHDAVVWGVFCLSDLKAKYQHGHFVDNYATEEEAIDAWNRRYDD